MTEKFEKPILQPFQQVDNEQKLKSLEEEVSLLSSALYEIQSSKAWQVLSFYRLVQSRFFSFFQALRFIRYVWAYPGGFSALVSKIITTLRQGGWRDLRASMGRYQQKQVQEVPMYIDRSLKARSDTRQTPSILFISHEATKTGAPVFLLNLIKFLAELLDMKIIILLRVGGELEPEFKELGSVVRLSDPNKIDASVLSVLLNNNIKLIYSNTVTNGIIQYQLRSLNCPVLCHVHELAFSIETSFGKSNFDWVRKTTSLFLAGSQAVANDLSGRWKIPPEQVIVAYPFINTQNNAKLALQEAPIKDIPLSTVIVGACGTLTWRKGPDIFLQIAQQVLRKIDQPVRFVWVGGTLVPEELAKLRYDAEMMGIDKNIVFTGYVSSHIQYLAQFDVFVLPSREDPFPLVVLDAATLGKPVVCFDSAGGAPEFVENDAGIITPYLDIGSMSDAIVTLISNPDLRIEMGKCARQKAAGFDISFGGNKILDIIKKALAANLQEHTR